MEEGDNTAKAYISHLWQHVHDHRNMTGDAGILNAAESRYITWKNVML